VNGDPETGELVRTLIEEDRRESAPLREILGRLADRRGDLEPLWRFLAIKELHDRAAAACRERAAGQRRLSWRLIRVLFLFAIAGGVGFIAWGGPRGFEAAIFFLCGGTVFYLLVQALLALRGRADATAVRQVEEACRRDYAELEERL
jgi:hypothetical protein